MKELSHVMPLSFKNDKKKVSATTAVVVEKKMTLVDTCHIVPSGDKK